MSDPIIDINVLSKRYKGAAVFAVKDLSLSVQEGEIYGLLGPNGAGKTTLISILCGLITPTDGEFSICGLTYKKSPKRLKGHTGVVPQDFAIYPSLSARENLQYFGSMFDLNGTDLSKRVDESLEALGLAEYANKRVETFSGGMKRRVNLLAAVLHKPTVLFLDEPTVGVDVHSKKAIMEYLRKLNSEGTTIVYSSHHLLEAQEFCSRVGIIESGQLLLEGSPEALIKKVDQARNLEDVFINLTGKGFRDV